MQVTLNVAQIQAARQFSGSRDVRYYLNGVHVECLEAGIRLASTDGTVASVQVNPRTESDTMALNFSIPNETCDDLVRRAKARGLSDVSVQQEGSRFIVCGCDLSFAALDGVFPDYRRVIPAVVSNEPSQFDPQQTGRFAKAAKILGNRDALILIESNGSGAAPVRIPNVDNFLGVIMPVTFKRWEPTPIREFTARFR